MSTTGIALIAENVVLLAVIAAGWHLLRQGGGLQLKTAPVPKTSPQERRDTGAAAPETPAKGMPGAGT